MNDSILESIKKMLGINSDYKHFDQEIIMHINTVIMGLRQMGVGPQEGFNVEDAGDEWSDYIEDIDMLSTVKSYIYMKVRMIFDTPNNSNMANSYNEIIKELEWRLNVQVDPER